MAQLIVRDLPDHVKKRLKQRAKAHGRSLEAEVREILADVAAPVATAAPTEATETTSQRLIRQQAQNRLSREDWDEFDRSIAELRRSWLVRDGGLGK